MSAIPPSLGELRQMFTVSKTVSDWIGHYLSLPLRVWDAVTDCEHVHGCVFVGEKEKERLRFGDVLSASIIQHVSATVAHVRLPRGWGVCVWRRSEGRGWVD